MSGAIGTHQSYINIIPPHQGSGNGSELPHYRDGLIQIGLPKNGVQKGVSLPGWSNAECNPRYFKWYS